MLAFLARQLLTEQLLNVKVPHVIKPAKDGILDIPILCYSMPDCQCEARVGRYEEKIPSIKKTHLISVSCKNSETLDKM
jgi:hypothetical protein